MNIEEAVIAATAGPSALLSCLGQPVLAYHVTAIMRETDARHAREMQLALKRRGIEALIDDGLDDSEAEAFAAQLDGCVGLTWDMLRVSDVAAH